MVADEGAIRIVPAQENVIYVPQYNPQVVYAEPSGVSTGAAVAASAISFGTGLAMGAWLNHDCNWYGGSVVWCQPGYWGGWRYAGAVHYPAGRWAAYGPARGAYVGPHGAAVWGDNGRGAVWRRSGTYGRPAYTGRYSSYNRVGGRNTAISGNRITAGNQVNINRNTANIDRGRTNIQGGGRTNIQGGGRTNIQGGTRSNIQGGTRAVDRGTRSGAFGGTGTPSQTRQYSERGSASRSQLGGTSSGLQGRQSAVGGRGGSRTNSFGDATSRTQTRSYSSRGASSRSGGRSLGGGGGMRGGGGGGGMRGGGGGGMRGGGRR